ncbi:MAG TPA: hypothetical protein PK299_00645 [Anaerolineales bacterium]|nr:hypothetical protein [Anaerolineales bacterium]
MLWGSVDFAATASSFPPHVIFMAEQLRRFCPQVTQTVGQGNYLQSMHS